MIDGLQSGQVCLGGLSSKMHGCLAVIWMQSGSGFGLSNGKFGTVGSKRDSLRTNFVASMYYALGTIGKTPNDSFGRKDGKRGSENFLGEKGGMTPKKKPCVLVRRIFPPFFFGARVAKSHCPLK